MDVGFVIGGIIVFGALSFLVFSNIWILREDKPPPSASNGSKQIIPDPPQAPAGEMPSVIPALAAAAPVIQVSAEPIVHSPMEIPEAATRAPEPTVVSSDPPRTNPRENAIEKWLSRVRDRYGRMSPVEKAGVISGAMFFALCIIAIIALPGRGTGGAVSAAATPTTDTNYMTPGYRESLEPQQRGRDFTIINQSSKSFTHINMRFLFQKWAVPPSGDAAIPSGTSATISFPPTSNDDECIAGVWLKFADGNEAVLGYDGIDICRTSQITLTNETYEPARRTVRYQTDKMDASRMAEDSKYGTLYFNQGWEKKEAAYRASVGHRNAIAQDCCEDHSPDPDFVQQCAPTIVKLRPQDSNGTASDQFGGAKILWVLSGNYISGPDSGRRYFKTLMALFALDGVRYSLTSVDCNLPFKQKHSVSFTWGGTNSWWNEIVDRAVQQKMAGTNLVNEDGYSFRCFSSEACTPDPAPRLGLPTMHDLMYGNTRTER